MEHRDLYSYFLRDNINISSHILVVYKRNHMFLSTTQTQNTRFYNIFFRDGNLKKLEKHKGREKGKQKVFLREKAELNGNWSQQVLVSVRLLTKLEKCTHQSADLCQAAAFWLAELIAATLDSFCNTSRCAAASFRSCTVIMRMNVF